MLVQFGNNWIQKIPRNANLDSTYGLTSNFGCPQNFSHPVISKLDSMYYYYIYEFRHNIVIVAVVPRVESRAN